MESSSNFSQDINKCLEVLNNGGVILYPTDTIWGLGCDATNEKAVERIYQIKKRSSQKGMLVLLDNENKIPSYVSEMPEIARDLIELSEKPLTIIYSGARQLAKNLVAQDGSIGIRISLDDFNQKLIRQFKKPLVSTSANFSGESAPQNFNEIDEEILHAVDYVVKWRQNNLTKVPPSSIIKLGQGGEIKIIRE